MTALAVAGVPISELLLLLVSLVAAGAVSGLLAGVFGVGGGTVIVPVLYEVFRLMGVPEEVRMQLCVGTSLAIIIPTSIRSFRAHHARNAVDIAVLRTWAIPVIIGVALGGAIAADAPAWLFKGVFVVVATILAVKLLFGRADWRLSNDMPGRAVMWLYGLVIGSASALIGIGGGSISNLLMSVHGRPIRQSVATSSGLGVIISIPGVIAYIIGGWPKMAMLPPLSIGYVSLTGVLLMVPTSMLAAPYGVRIAHALSQRRLELILGLYLLFVAGRFLFAMLN
ncbi:sulfite exporter TauE/SafE family protein [Sphingobium subterraneum]|uniref:Probable membrane transporter protein n=1 Tax=Sphingobium subterraneum TaxID=627688 RepID=A0A841IYR3_9SPHN|nr:sulfite exporter TauE/SafE family protein [Sphingobium subterraneum]MBB6123272.1 putative membrane protein YfcA [Sphingobium subterraneum]